MAPAVKSPPMAEALNCQLPLSPRQRPAESSTPHFPSARSGEFCRRLNELRCRSPRSIRAARRSCAQTLRPLRLGSGGICSSIGGRLDHGGVVIQGDFESYIVCNISCLQEHVRLLVGLIGSLTQVAVQQPYDPEITG